MDFSSLCKAGVPADAAALAALPIRVPAVPLARRFILTRVSHGITLSYMSPEEGKTITVRLDAQTLTKLANLADTFMEQDPLERDVSTSELVRRAINMLYATTFAEVIDEDEDA